MSCLMSLGRSFSGHIRCCCVYARVRNVTENHYPQRCVGNFLCVRPVILWLFVIHPRNSTETNGLHSWCSFWKWPFWGTRMFQVRLQRNEMSNLWRKMWPFGTARNLQSGPRSCACPGAETPKDWTGRGSKSKSLDLRI